MGFLEKIKNVGSAVGNATGRAIEGTMQARERRARSPAFQAEMAKESQEFMHTLGEMGSHTWDLGVGAVLKTPYHLFANGLKTIHNKKYGAKEYMGDALKLFVGKDGIVHNTAKVTASALHLGAKGAKIGVRKLFAL